MRRTFPGSDPPPHCRDHHVSSRTSTPSVAEKTVSLADAPLDRHPGHVPTGTRHRGTMTREALVSRRPSRISWKVFL